MIYHLAAKIVLFSLQGWQGCGKRRAAHLPCGHLIVGSDDCCFSLRIFPPFLIFIFYMGASFFPILFFFFSFLPTRIETNRNWKCFSPNEVVVVVVIP